MKSPIASILLYVYNPNEDISMYKERKKSVMNIYINPILIQVQGNTGDTRLYPVLFSIVVSCSW